MTFTLSTEHLYLGVILILMVIQVYQWRVIYRSHKEFDDLWSQLGLLAAGLAEQIISIQRELNNKEDKKSVE